MIKLNYLNIPHTTPRHFQRINTLFHTQEAILTLLHTNTPPPTHTHTPIHTNTPRLTLDFQHTQVHHFQHTPVHHFQHPPEHHFQRTPVHHF